MDIYAIDEADRTLIQPSFVGPSSPRFSAIELLLLCLPLGCIDTHLFPNHHHCAQQSGDRWCAEQHADGSRPFCLRGFCKAEGEPDPRPLDGCVSARPDDDACYSPCGGQSTLAENDECLMNEGSSSGSSSGWTEASSGSSATGPMPCTGDQDCPDAAAPFCEPATGGCVACDGTEDPDGACRGVDPGLPVCAGGVCVQCTAENPVVCTGKTPACDEGTNTCVPCTAHNQCGGAACNLFEGICLPSDAVVHVRGSEPDFATLEEAVESFGPDEEGTIVVHADIFSYNESVTVSAGRTIAILAAEIGPEIDPPRWLWTPGGTSQLTVEAGTTVLADGLQLSGNPSSSDPAVLVDGGRLWLDRSRVVQNSGGGIIAQSNAELVLRNCFVGTEESEQDALTVTDATASILYATVVGGYGAFGQSRAIACGVGTDVVIRNSLVVSIDDVPEIECSMAEVSYSATETANPGMGNATLGNLQPGWLVNETNDFHLDMPPTVIQTTARWASGDPPTDIDGDPRPTVDGTPDYAGADVPVAAARLELNR